MSSTYLPSVLQPVRAGLNPTYVREVQEMARQWPTMLQEINVPGFTVIGKTERAYHWYVDFVINFDCLGIGADLRRDLIYKVAERIDSDYRKTGTTNIYLTTALSLEEVFSRFADVTKMRDRLTVGHVAESMYAVDDCIVYIHPVQR
jgi:hypothetical protein